MANHKLHQIVPASKQINPNNKQHKSATTRSYKVTNKLNLLKYVQKVALSLPLKFVQLQCGSCGVALIVYSVSMVSENKPLCYHCLRTSLPTSLSPSSLDIPLATRDGKEKHKLHTQFTHSISGERNGTF